MTVIDLKKLRKVTFHKNLNEAVKSAWIKTEKEINRLAWEERNGKT